MYNCPKYDSCNASICPLDSSGSIWYPDEDICNRRFKECPDLIKMQRKIAKKVKPENTHYFFTRTMLEQNCKVTVNIKGLDPDSRVDKDVQEDKWLEKHPEYVMSEKQRKQAAKLGHL